MADFTGFPIPTEVFDPAAFAGADGREVEFSVNATHLRWRYAGTTPWTNLLALADIKGEPGTPGDPGTPGADSTVPGPAGPKVEMRATATHIQQRPEGGSWANLVAFSEMGLWAKWSGTQVQYDALGTYDSNTLYVIKE